MVVAVVAAGAHSFTKVSGFVHGKHASFVYGLTGEPLGWATLAKRHTRSSMA